MPAHSYTIKSGTRSKVLLLYARDATTGGGATELRHDTPEASAAFIRDGDPEAVQFALAPGSVGQWNAGGFVEVDPVLVPGVYQLGAPDGVLAEGSTRASLVVQFPGVVIEPVEIDLVRFDPLDPVRLGMSALGPEGRIEALRGAFPRLAAKEIREMEAKRGE